MSEQGRMVRDDSGRWVYLTHAELVEASDRRWAAIVATSEADEKRVAVAESQAADLARDLESYVGERRRMIDAITKNQRNGKAKG